MALVEDVKGVRVTQSAQDKVSYTVKIAEYIPAEGFDSKGKAIAYASVVKQHTPCVRDSDEDENYY